MNPRSNLRGRCLAAVLLCLAAFGEAQAQDDRHRPGTRLDFLRGASQLTDDAAVSSWAAGALHRRLGLAASDRLKVAGEPRRLRGHAIYSLAQTLAELPVVHRESRLLLNGDRKPVHLLGHHTPFPDPPSADPTLGLDDVLAAAHASDAHPPTGRLVFWPDGDELKLSYELEGWFLKDEETGFERVYVDAHKGAVLQRLSLTHPGLDRRVYDFGAACRDRKVRRVVGWRRSLRLARRAMKRHIRSEVSHRGNAEVERLFERFGEVYRFLEATLDMDSLDDRGGTLHGFIGVRVHPTAPPPQCIGDAFNAFWHGGLNAFLLPSAALDYSEIIGHEIGHAIIHWGSGLIYKSQPGALNEAIADAVGVTFRAWLENGGTGLPADVPARVWQLRHPGGVIRDMRDPASLMDPQTGKPYPDHFDDYRHVSVDNGGVHINSSIMNQGYYLLAMGGQHPRLRSGPEVQGVGLAKALRIFGRAASDLLTPNAGFEAARYAFAAVAEILYGESSPEWVATHTAMDAIGIPGYWNPIEPEPEPEAEPAPQPEPEPPPRPAPSPKPVPAPQPQEEPAPEPKPAPDPGKPDIPLPEPGESLRPAQQMILWIVTAILLLVAGFALVKFRPGRDSMRGAARAHADAFGALGEENRAGPVPPPAAVVPARAVGTLIPLDGSEPIPLRRDLLTSAEGLVIGRARELCHVEIRHPQVSRRHLRLRLVDGAIWVEDLNSTRGTEVDANRPEPFKAVRLHSGQLVRIAAFPYQFKS